MTKFQKYFLSYSHKNLEDVKSIGKILMLHGIKTWQDINNLGSGLTEIEIRNAIQKDCSGLVFYSTSDSLTAPMVRGVELKLAEEKFLQDKTFHIVPIFKSSIDETNAALHGCLKTKISDFNGSVVGDKNMFDVASRAAAIILKNLNFPPGVLPIGLASYQKTSEEVALDLDMTPYFVSNLPSVDIWNREFVPALVTLKDYLLAKQKTHLRLFARVHLSLGFAVGYVFRDRTGFVLEIEQINKPNREIWSTAATEETSPLTIDCVPVGNHGSKDLVVNINLMSNDNNSFQDYVKKSGLYYRAMIEAKPKAFPCLISNGQAVLIARELTQKIKEAHGQYGTNIIHLFAAVPLGLALLIGHQLNACGTIQCYEFDKAKREYYPSVRLENF